MDSFSSSKKRMLTLAVMRRRRCSLPVMAAPADGDVVRTKDVIVTATRTEEEVKVVPQNVEVITSEDIEKLGATDVYQALKLASNVDVTRAGMAGHNVMIRGMSTNHTLILVNACAAPAKIRALRRNVYALDRLSYPISNASKLSAAGVGSVRASMLSAVSSISISKKSGAEQMSVTVGASTGTSSINNYPTISISNREISAAALDINF